MAGIAAPVIVQPDAEAWVWANIGHLRGVTSFAYAAAWTWPGWIYAHHVQVDARAKTKNEARDLAEHVRQIICALPDQPWDDGAVCLAEPEDGPFWLPDRDGGPRYVARYEIRVHPRHGTAGGTMPPDAAPATIGGNS